MTIDICDFDSVPLFADKGITHVISLGSHGMPLPALGQFRGAFTLHRFVFDDLSHLDPKGPSMDIVADLIDAFAAIPDEGSHVLFHCTAGRSRSPAAALIFLAMRRVSFADAYTAISKGRGGDIQPNALMIQLADHLLGYDGAMLDYVVKASGQTEWEPAVIT